MGLKNEDTKICQAALLAAQLINKSELKGYKIKLHNKRRVLADCNSFHKIIRFSTHFIKVATKEQFEGVTLHEMAHALVGNGHNHDWVFKQKCIDLGADSNYIGCRAKGVTIPAKYNLTCPDCGATSRANVRKDYICNKCKKGGRSVSFKYTENILQVILW